MEADADPGALTVMASVDADLAAAGTAIDDNLARAQVGAERLAEERAYDQAERYRAAVDEPVMQAELDASATIERAKADHDADLEIRPSGISQRLPGSTPARPAR